jgi:hypothetical protein
VVRPRDIWRWLGRQPVTLLQWCQRETEEHRPGGVCRSEPGDVSEVLDDPFGRDDAAHLERQDRLKRGRPPVDVGIDLPSRLGSSGGLMRGRSVSNRLDCIGEGCTRRAVGNRLVCRKHLREDRSRFSRWGLMFDQLVQVVLTDMVVDAND